MTNFGLYDDIQANYELEIAKSDRNLYRLLFFIAAVEVLLNAVILAFGFVWLPFVLGILWAAWGVFTFRKWSEARKSYDLAVEQVKYLEDSGYSWEAEYVKLHGEEINLEKP